MHLHEKLNFNTHNQEKIKKKNNKDFTIICQLAHLLHRQSLITICKSFFRPHIVYGDIMYDQAKMSIFVI